MDILSFLIATGVGLFGANLIIATAERAKACAQTRRRLTRLLRADRR